MQRGVGHGGGGGGGGRRGGNSSKEEGYRGAETDDGYGYGRPRGARYSDGEGCSYGAETNAAATYQRRHGKRVAGEGADTYLRGPLAGKRFIVLSASTEKQEQCADYERKIFNLGGELISSIQYELATHILTLDDIGEGAIKLWTIEGKRVVSSDWIEGCSNLSGSDCTTPSSSNCQRAVTSTSKRKRLRVEGNSASHLEFFSEENENGKFHHWLHCPFDTSETFTIEEFFSNNKDHVTQLVPTPGSDNNHLSILAATEVKLYSRKSYLAMAAMHDDGMTMRGNFGAVNFVVDRSRSVKIGNLTTGKLKEIKSKDDVDMDKNSFANMIKNEVLRGKSIPDDIYEWIFALLSGEPRELLSCHIGLLEDFLGGHILMTLYDRLLDLEKDDSEAYNSVILALSQYDGWQRKRRFLGNSFLKQTFHYKDKTGKETVYKDNVRGLLHLLRNCKRHAAISVELFSCIVGQYFRQIASDFQKAMHKVGCLQKLNLHYILS